MLSFFSEIKRRKVFQIAAVYAVVAWLLVQIVATVEEPLGLPAWFDTAIIVLLAVGFPIALILSWAFELTPEGVRSASRVASVAESRDTGGHRLTYVLQTLVLLAVLILIVDQYALRPSGDAPIENPAIGESLARHVTRFDRILEDDQEFRDPGRPIVSISPNGAHFVYNTESGVYLRFMSELDPRPISGAERRLNTPFLSPGGETLAYWDLPTQAIRRIAVRGGASTPVATGVSSPYGASWAPDDTILFAQPEGIYRVPASGESAAELIIPTEEGRQAYGPRLLPDGDSVLFSIAPVGDWDAGEVVVQSSESGERHVLFAGGTSAQYLPTGHLVYAFEDTLYGVAFDPASLTVSGSTVALVEGIRRGLAAWQSGVAQYDVSRDGTLIYAAAETTESEFVWVDRQGRETSVPVPAGDYAYPRISPDGTRVALDETNAANDIWVLGIDDGTLARLTLGPFGGDWVAWHPDGTRIAYHPSTGEAIDWHSTNNVGSPERLTTGPSTQIGFYHPETFTPSGDQLLFSGRSDPATGIDIGMITIGGDAEPVWLFDSPYNERNAVISPDGRWIAYQSDESGRPEIYVHPFPDVGRDRWTVSNNGGATPVWSPDGRELFYVEPGLPGQLMSVSVETQDAELSIAGRVPLFDWRYVDVGREWGRTYDVAEDGERFIVVKKPSDGRSSSNRRIIVVENWFEELERLMAAAQ